MCNSLGKKKKEKALHTLIEQGIEEVLMFLQIEK